MTVTDNIKNRPVSYNSDIRKIRKEFFGQSARKTSGSEIRYHRCMRRVFFMKRFFMVLWMTVMIPYVTTLAWTGRIRTDTGAEVPAEEFLTGVVAAEIPAEYGIETLKAQAVDRKSVV